MKRRSVWKKRIFVIITLLGLWIFPVYQVIAGDINGEEASLLAYVSQEFNYEGYDYTATGAAIAELRALLLDDGVDLSADDVRTAKAEFRNNIKAGIEAGYLVKVSKDPVNSGDKPTEENGDKVPNGSNGVEDPDKAGSKTPDNTEATDPVNGTDSEAPPESNGKTDPVRTDSKAPESNGKTDPVGTGSEASENNGKTDPTDGTDSEVTESNGKTDPVVTDSETPENQGSVPADGNQKSETGAGKTDLTGENGTVISGSDDGNSKETDENEEPGGDSTDRIAEETGMEGEKGRMVKNTGYDSRSAYLAYGVLLTAAILTMGTALAHHFLTKEYE